MDFGFTTSKVKVTSVTFIKWVVMFFSLIILITICHRAFIFHMLISLGANMICIDFGFNRSKAEVTRVFLSKMVSANFLDN